MRSHLNVELHFYYDIAWLVRGMSFWSLCRILFQSRVSKAEIIMLRWKNKPNQVLTSVNQVLEDDVDALNWTCWRIEYRFHLRLTMFSGSPNKLKYSLTFGAVLLGDEMLNNLALFWSTKLSGWSHVSWSVVEAPSSLKSHIPWHYEWAL